MRRWRGYERAIGDAYSPELVVPGSCAVATRKLRAWFDRVSKRPSYAKGLIDWLPEAASGTFAVYTEQRRAQRTDLRAYAILSD